MRLVLGLGYEDVGVPGTPSTSKVTYFRNWRMEIETAKITNLGSQP